MQAGDKVQYKDSNIREILQLQGDYFIGNKTGHKYGRVDGQPLQKGE